MERLNRGTESRATEGEGQHGMLGAWEMFRFLSMRLDIVTEVCKTTGFWGFF